MIVTFYDRKGKAIAYINDNGESIYLYNGKPVAWLSEDSIYSYNKISWMVPRWVGIR